VNNPRKSRSPEDALSRCDRELAEIRAGESSGPAYLPALGEADWHTERNLIEKEITPNE
jgi:hypothetical protein